MFNDKIHFMINVAFIGHSHLGAINRARHYYKDRSDLDLKLFLLNSNQYQIIDGNSHRLSEKLICELVSFFKENKENYIVTAIGGNEHNIIGIVNHPQMFDFILSSNPDMEINDKAKIIPEKLVESIFNKRLGSKFKEILSLRDAFSIPIIVLQPPPVKSNEQVLKSGGIFAERIKLHGVSPITLRKKLWILQSELVRKFCEEQELIFLPIPTESIGDDGCMVEQASKDDDPTHANQWYGKKVLENIIKLISEQNEKTPIQ